MKTRFKIYNGKILAILKIYKIWKYYLKDYKYQMFMLMYYNNL